VSPHGKLRVIRSSDGEVWESGGLLEHPDYDLRDACLSEMPDGRLMVLGGAQQANDGSHPTGTVVSFSSDGETWTPPELVLPLPRWLWRVTWNGDEAYGFVYGGGPDKEHSLLSTNDGLRYEHIKADVPAPHGGGWLTEARVRFDDNGTAYCLQRRDGKENSALLGVAAPPYRSWQWRDLGLYFGGPNSHTDVTWLDVENGRMTSLLTLPSGGDCSYPGMVWHDDLLWISYYSSHEGKTSIYLAKVRLSPR
jgi:hypothetical protein